jgi:hypothetical protein
LSRFWAAVGVMHILIWEEEGRSVLRLFLFSSAAQFGAVIPKLILKSQIKIDVFYVKVTGIAQSV